MFVRLSKQLILLLPAVCLISNMTNLIWKLDQDVIVLNPLTLGVNPDVLHVLHAGEGLEVFLVDQAVGSGYQPVGGNYRGCALDSGGRLEVEYCHEGRPLVTLSHKASHDSVLTFPAGVHCLGEKGEEEERDKYCVSHDNIVTLLCSYCNHFILRRS